MDPYTYKTYTNDSGKPFSQPSTCIPSSSNFNMINTTPNYNFPAPSYQSLDPRLNYAHGSSNYSNAITTNQLFNLPQTDLSVENKSDDELWIETWLSKIGKIQINLNNTVEIKSTDFKKKLALPKTVIQIHTAKCALRNCLNVINKLQKMQEELKQNATKMSSAEWKKKTLEIGTLKDDFSKVIAQFENPEMMQLLLRTVEKRRKKRKNQRQRKLSRKIYLNEMVNNRQQLHKDIDQWLESMKEDVERTKMEENMKRDADCILAEVTKKKSDARKQLSLITALVKLRNVREQTAIQRGEKVSLADQAAFTHVTNRLTKMWEDSLNVYMKEEQGLRTMLEQNADEDSKAVLLAKEKKAIQDWESVFFGLKWVPSQIYWGLTAAERELETFIAMRKSWDTFLVHKNNDQGSKIPIGWVLPDQNARDDWIKFQQLE